MPSGFDTVIVTAKRPTQTAGQSEWDFMRSQPQFYVPSGPETDTTSIGDDEPLQVQKIKLVSPPRTRSSRHFHSTPTNLRKQLPLSGPFWV